MAYEFNLGALEGPYTDDQWAHIVEFILGMDAAQNVVVVMSVILFPTDNPDVLELCFGIRTKGETFGISEPDYGKESAAKYIPKNQRADVLQKIKEAVESIVSSKMPAYIAMETYYPNLPPEALTKYSVIGAGIIILGYVIEDQFRDPESGINYWFFRKRDWDWGLRTLL